MRCHIYENDEQLPILLYYSDISKTPLAKWLVQCVEGGALESVTREAETKDRDPTSVDPILEAVRTHFYRFFLDGTTIFSHKKRTNWNCIRLVKQAGILSSFSFAELESHVVSGKLAKGAEIRLPDFFADLLKGDFRFQPKQERRKTLAGSIKYHLALAYLIGDNFPTDGTFVFSRAVTRYEANTLDEILREFVLSPDYFLTVPKPPGYRGNETLHEFPLVYGMSTWPDSTIPSFDDIRSFDWSTIQWSAQKVQAQIGSLLNLWNIDLKRYGDTCVFNLRDFCLKAGREYVACILPFSGIPNLSDQSLRRALAAASEVHIHDKISAARTLLKDRSFILAPEDIKNLDVEKMKDPLLSVELPNSQKIRYCRLVEYLAKLHEDEIRKSEYPPHSGWLAVLCSLKGSN
jgi:hypothetical protein